MPDIARWNGMDQLSEKFHTTSPYAYVTNNPISFFDPDGRDKQSSGNWLQDMWDATDSYSYWTNNGNGAFVGGNVEGGISQQQYSSFYNFLAGGGTGNYTYWTGGAQTGYFSNGEGYGTSDMTMHVVNIKGSSNSWEGTKNWADWSATTMEGMFRYTADSRTSFYNNGNWIDNLGNVRSTKYAGRAKGSLIGLRSDYVKTTAKFGKYAKGAGVVGYAISAGEIGYGVYEDGGKFGHNAQVKTVGVAGGLAGAAAGAWAVGKVFGAAGLLVGPEGAAVAGAVGAIIGGIAGGYYGGEYMENWAENIFK